MPRFDERTVEIRRNLEVCSGIPSEAPLGSRSGARRAWGTHKPRNHQAAGLACGGEWGIRTPEGFHPTRFPSVRHRPLGEFSRPEDVTRRRRGSRTGVVSPLVGLLRAGVTPGEGERAGPSRSIGRVFWCADPSYGVISLNSPRAGRQQGQVGSGGCAGGPCFRYGAFVARPSLPGPLWWGGV